MKHDQDPSLKLLQRYVWWMGLSFLIFFGGGLMLVVTGLDQTVMQYKYGPLCMSLLRWGTGGKMYEVMLCSVYVAWGVLLMRVPGRLHESKALLDFTLWGNVAHFGSMGVMALLIESERQHLYGDVMLGIGLLIPFAILWLWTRSRIVPNQVVPK